MRWTQEDIDTIVDDVVERTLRSPIHQQLFFDTCQKLSNLGISLLRVNMSWGTLHPTIEALSMTWWKDKPADDDVNLFYHQESASEQWLSSPGYYAIENQITHLDISLETRPFAYPFPVLDEVHARGATQYMLNLYSFSDDAFENDGMFISWVSDRPGGFSAQERVAIANIEKHMALALKMALRERIALNTLTAYLGENAAMRVLKGNIRLGDGEIVNAVIWLSDLRKSTDLGDTLPGPELLKTLNDYFYCTAGSVKDHGGEVLRFIGDAVLAIFPTYENNISEACQRATLAAREAVVRINSINDLRIAEGKEPLTFGLGLHIGELMFGNIGIPERLDFAVTGPAANEVARIEAVTKEVPADILASGDFITHIPTYWQSIGRHNLRGVGREIELFSLK